MPYIDSVEQLEYEMYDKTAMEDFGRILEKNGWTRLKKFYKVVIGRKQYTYSRQEEEDTTITLNNRAYRPYMYAAAKHVLYKNAQGKILGMAETISDSYKILPKEMVEATSTSVKLTDEIMEAFKTRFKETFDANKTKGLIYFYTAEKVPSVEEDFVTITYPIESLTADSYFSTALDIEVNGLTIYPTGSIPYSATADKRDLTRSANFDYIRPFAEPRVMQSTIVPVELYNTIAELDSAENVYSSLNKWDDSIITVKGRIDGNNLTVLFQSDNSANWSDNRYPIVPLHFGEVEMDNGREGVYCLFGGVTPPTPDFDFSSVSKYTGNLNTKLVVPVLKAYPSYPGDGVNNVVLSRTLGGARYQAVYLSWGASPDTMPPERVGKNNKKYPASLDYNVKNFGFNPSRYSDSVHTSNVYVVHPEDGIIGKLKDIVGLQTFATNNPELRIVREDCLTKVTDTYQVFTVGSICPFTKRPSTTYSVAGIALRDSTVEKAKYTTVPKLSNVKITSNEHTAKITWEVDPTDYFHMGVRLKVNGEDLLPIVSNVKYLVLDLNALGVNPVSDVFTITSVNNRGRESEPTTVTS